MENASVNRMHTILASRACMINTGWAEVSDAEMCVVSQSIMGNVVFHQGCGDEASL